MARMLFASLLVCFGLQASAFVGQDTLVLMGAKTLTNAQTLGLEFKKGESGSYNVNMGFITGTMVMSVFDIVSEGVWIHQDMDMMLIGKQKIEILMDPNTGEIKKILVNGKEEQIPARGDVEVVETREEQLTVPAGTFATVYFKVLDKTKNETVQQWVNLKDIPVFGMVKTVAPSQIGEVTMELTAFKKL
jgi:hypothetical protein